MGKKILWYGYCDPGGIGKMYAHAINTYTEHECRNVSMSETRGFDSDVVLERSMWGAFNLRPNDVWGNEFHRLLEWCDTFILNFAVFPGASDPSRTADDTQVRIGNIPLLDMVKDKNCFGFYFGSTTLRRNYDYYIDICRKNNWPVITCQPDIHHNVKDKWQCSYVPILVDLSHPRYRNSVFHYLDDDHFEAQQLMVAHSPTDKGIKNTEEFIKALHTINAKHGKECVRPVMIDNHGAVDSIHLKKMCHAAFDQMQVGDGYYCLSSVENMALGLINIVHLDQYAIDLITQDVGKMPPWKIVSSQKELTSTLQDLYDNLDGVYGQMKEAYNYTREYWNDQKLIHKLVNCLG